MQPCLTPSLAWSKEVCVYCAFTREVSSYPFCESSA